jgi:hypothetical protein
MLISFGTSWHPPLSYTQKMLGGMTMQWSQNGCTLGIEDGTVLDETSHSYVVHIGYLMESIYSDLGSPYISEIVLFD